MKNYFTNTLKVGIFIILLCTYHFAQAKKTIEDSPKCCYPIVGGNHKIGFIDENGKVKILPKFTNISASLESVFFYYGFSEGLAAVNGDQEYLSEWKFINDKEEAVVNSEYAKTHKFYEGLAAVLIDGSKKWGFINNKNEMIIDAKYVAVKNFSEGLATVSENGKTWGFINDKGQWVVNPVYSKAADFSEGFAAVRLGNGKLNFIDKKGNISLKTNFSFAEFSDSVTDSFLKNLNKINKKSYEDLDEDVSFAEDINQRDGETPRFSEGLFPIKIGKKWGFIDNQGKIVISARFNVAGNFQEGLARVAINGLYGFINSKGKIIIPLKYKFASDFSNNLAFVFFSFTYRDVSGLDVNGGNYEDGSRRINIAYGYINKKGQTIFRGKHIFDAAVTGGDLSAGMTLPFEVGISIISNPPNSLVYFVPSTQAKNFNYDDVDRLNSCCWLGETDGEGNLSASRTLGNYYVLIMKQGRRSVPRKFVLNENAEVNNIRISLE